MFIVYWMSKIHTGGAYDMRDLLNQGKKLVFLFQFYLRPDIHMVIETRVAFIFCLVFEYNLNSLPGSK